MSSTNDANRTDLADAGRTPSLPAGIAGTVPESVQNVPSQAKRIAIVDKAELSADEKDERDVKKKQEFKGRYLFWF